jgi:hypothetical protein
MELAKPILQLQAHTIHPEQPDQQGRVGSQIRDDIIAVELAVATAMIIGVMSWGIRTLVRLAAESSRNEVWEEVVDQRLTRIENALYQKDNQSG